MAVLSGFGAYATALRIADLAAGAARKTAEGLAKHFQDEEHPFTACMRELADQYPDEEQRKRVCGKAKSMIPGAVYGKKAATDGEFPGGFEGCVSHFMDTKNLSEDHARALCAYIGRRAGKIPPAKKRDAAHGHGTETRVLAFKRHDRAKKIAYVEAYVPYDLDSQAEYMTPEDVALMAHRFLAQKLNHQIDFMHNGRAGYGVLAESFVNDATVASPHFVSNAWVVGVHFPDERMWQAALKGDIGGISFEALVDYDTETIDVPDESTVTGTTFPAEGHTHDFALKVDAVGNVLGGQVSPAADGHTHTVARNTRTEVAQGHRHTFQMAHPIEAALAAAKAA